MEGAAVEEEVEKPLRRIDEEERMAELLRREWGTGIPRKHDENCIVRAH